MNNMEEIYYKEEARNKIIAGINKLADAVESTMGPNGKTAIIPSSKEYNKYIVTKDGVSVARQIHLKDVVENIGASLIKEVAELQVDLAGDGTTTAICLARALVNNLKDFDSNDINDALDELVPKIIEQLKLNSRELKNEDIKYVASISANNDVQIGDIIQQAYNHTSIIKVEESSSTEDSIELIEGMSIPVSYFSKVFINNPKKAECLFESPRVLLLDGKLEDLGAFEIPIKYCAENNESLLIITEYVTDSVLKLLEKNVINNALKICVIKTPGFAQHRKDLVRDLSDITGASIISDFTKKYTKQDLGILQSCKISKSNSLLVKHKDIDISELLENLQSLLELNDMEGNDIDLIKQRIENLTGKISLIKVGGGSEVEMKERFDRYDDAVKAVACALEEGIVEGGGVALFKAIITLLQDNDCVDNRILISLTNPYITIFPKLIINDVRHLELNVNMFNKNIIDPFKVTRCALENAVSVVKTILSTDSVIISRESWS